MVRASRVRLVPLVRQGRLAPQGRRVRQARQALEAYVEEGEDPAQLKACATFLHQVQGTLRMVELYGAAMVAEEMEQLAKALNEGRVADRDVGYAALMRGIVQLPDYLERLQSGHRDIPIVLLPAVMLSLGLSWFLASLGVFLRDLSQVIGLLLQALVFLTPIFYPLDVLFDKMIGPFNVGRLMHVLNPMASFISTYRLVLIDGAAPDPAFLARTFTEALVVLAVGNNDSAVGMVLLKNALHLEAYLLVSLDSPVELTGNHRDLGRVALAHELFVRLDRAKDCVRVGVLRILDRQPGASVDARVAPDDRSLNAAL